MPMVQDREYRAMTTPLMIPAETVNKRFDSDYYVEGYATTFDDPYMLFEWDGVKYYERIAADALNVTAFPSISIVFVTAIVYLHE